MNISEQAQYFQIRDSLRVKQDSLLQKPKILTGSVRVIDSASVKKIYQAPARQIVIPVDTVTVSGRNPVSDVTFYDSTNIINHLDEKQVTSFPYVFTGRNRERENAARIITMKHLREGRALADNPFHHDWVIFIVLIASFLYSSIRTFSRSFFPEVIRFFTFRGIGDEASGDISEIFRWQSTIVNLISFFNIALFIYCLASYYDFIPGRLPGILTWIAAFIIVVFAVTSRHAVCYFAGQLSGRSRIFNEYMINVYLSYRYAGLLLFIISILLSYTTFLKTTLLLDTGIAVVAILYLFRVTRLLLIFLKRDVSILYLILYLCALEILPVLVTIKYFAGLF